MSDAVAAVGGAGLPRPIGSGLAPGIAAGRSRFALPAGLSVPSLADMRRLTGRPDILLASGVAMVIFNDAWFYWVHRLLHTRWLFRHVHRVHHRSVDVTPFTTYSFHPLEALLLSLWIVPWVFVVPTWVPVLAGVQLYGYLENLKSHLGYEFYPGWFARAFPTKWLTTSTYHNVHHTSPRGNYALTFRWWDRWLGTEVADYASTFDALPRTSR